MSNVLVVGLGYVGLSTAVHAAESGFSVFGIDTSMEKLKKIKLGESYIEDISNERIIKLINKSFQF
jgi:UDP-N-acetyl-D-mannosaminuronate dehydrogenase